MKLPISDETLINMSIIVLIPFYLILCMVYMLHLIYGIFYAGIKYVCLFVKEKKFVRAFLLFVLITTVVDISFKETLLALRDISESWGLARARFIMSAMFVLSLIGALTLKELNDASSDRNPFSLPPLFGKKEEEED